ncbi:hypothetical protein JL720_7521 [Aureococcus anophagefferens]|nr:hypothetical protein JL720_7521 [Aureococcus anophagefferens]
MGGCGSKIRDAPNHAVVVAPAPLPSPPSSKAPSPSKKVAPTPAAAQPAADVAANTPPSASAAPARAASPAPRSDDAAALPSPNRLAPLDPTLTTPLATIDVVPASPALESRHVEDESESRAPEMASSPAGGAKRGRSIGAIDRIINRENEAFRDDVARPRATNSFRGAFVNDYYGDKNSEPHIWEPRPEMGWVNDYYAHARSHERQDNRNNAGLVSDYYGDRAGAGEAEAAAPPQAVRTPRYTRTFDFADTLMPAKAVAAAPAPAPGRRRAPSSYGVLGGAAMYAPRSSRLKVH